MVNNWCLAECLLTDEAVLKFLYRLYAGFLHCLHLYMLYIFICSDWKTLVRSTLLTLIWSMVPCFVSYKSHHIFLYGFHLGKK